MAYKVALLSCAGDGIAEVSLGGNIDPSLSEEDSNATLENAVPQPSDTLDAEPSFTEPSASEAMELSSMKSPRKILIVDDEETIADTLALIFATQHYEVKVAYSAEKAIEIISVWRPDMAILDVVLPGMNGIDLAIVVKSNYSACRILLFSGHSNTGILLEEAVKKGHQFEVLPKPLHPTLMLERVSALLSSSPERPALD